MPTALAQEVTLAPYAVEVDENIAQVISCPHCVSSSIGMRSPVSTSQQEGSIRADILTVPLYCNDCGTEWSLELVAHSGQRGLKPLDLVIQIGKAA